MRNEREILHSIVAIGFFAVIFALSNKRDGCEVRKAKYLFCLVFVFDAIIKVVDKKGKGYGGKQTDEKSNGEVSCFFGPDGRGGSNCRINNVNVADGGCLGNTGLLLLLEEEGVDAARYCGQAGVASQIALFGGDALQLTLINRHPLGKVGLLFGEVIDAGIEGVFDFLLNFVNLRLHGFNRRVVFGVLNHKRPFFNFKGG